MDILLAGGPDAGVELSEQEPVVPSLPAVHHFVRVRLVDSVVDALVRPQLAALGLGDPLRPDAPVRGYEGGDGEEQRQEVQADGQKGPAPPPIGLHCPPKFMGASWRRLLWPRLISERARLRSRSRAALRRTHTCPARRRLATAFPHWAPCSRLTAPSLHCFTHADPPAFRLYDVTLSKDLT